jgi:hypothetical protein
VRVEQENVNKASSDQMFSKSWVKSTIPQTVLSLCMVSRALHIRIQTCKSLENLNGFISEYGLFS